PSGLARCVATTWPPASRKVTLAPGASPVAYTWLTLPRASITSAARVTPALKTPPVATVSTAARSIRRIDLHRSFLLLRPQRRGPHYPPVTKGARGTSELCEPKTTTGTRSPRRPSWDAWRASARPGRAARLLAGGRLALERTVQARQERCRVVFL